MLWGVTCQFFSISGGSTTLMETLCEYMGSGYCQKLIDYPCFDLRLYKRCLLRTASKMICSLDGYRLTECIVNQLKGAETRDWMSFRHALRKATLTNNLSKPHLVDLVANIIGEWPLIVSSYLEETGRKDDRDSLVVKSSSFDCICAFSYPCSLYLWCSEERNGLVFLLGPNGANEFSFAAFPSWNLKMFP